MKRGAEMKNRSNLGHDVLRIIIWITSVLVALAVGLAMIDNAIAVSFIPSKIVSLAGWLIVIMAVVGALISVFSERKN